MMSSGMPYQQAVCSTPHRRHPGGKVLGKTVAVVLPPHQPLVTGSHCLPVTTAAAVYIGPVVTAVACSVPYCTAAPGTDAGAASSPRSGAHAPPPVAPRLSLTGCTGSRCRRRVAVGVRREPAAGVSRRGLCLGLTGALRPCRVDGSAGASAWHPPAAVPPFATKGGLGDAKRSLGVVIPVVPPTVAAFSPSALGLVGRSGGRRAADPGKKLTGVEAPAVHGPVRVGFSPFTSSSSFFSSSSLLVPSYYPCSYFFKALVLFPPLAVVPDAAAAAISLLIPLRRRSTPRWAGAALLRVPSMLRRGRGRIVSLAWSYLGWGRWKSVVAAAAAAAALLLRWRRRNGAAALLTGPTRRRSGLGCPPPLERLLPRSRGRRRRRR